MDLSFHKLENAKNQNIWRFSIMKKISTLILAIVLVLSMTACGGETTTTDDVTNTDVVSETNEEAGTTE